jgi:hypothetical protein
VTRAARRHRNWHYARRAQRLHLRQAHADGVLDCICERSVWYFEKIKAVGHRRHCWMCHPKYGERLIRPRLQHFTRRYDMWPPRWFFNVNARG